MASSTPAASSSSNAYTPSRRASVIKTIEIINHSANVVGKWVLLGIYTFILLALFGIAVQVMNYVNSKTPKEIAESISSQFARNENSNNNSNNKDEEPSLIKLALQTTYLALKLWFKLVLSILIPTTEKGVLYAKEGYSVLQPSVLSSLKWLVQDSSKEFKIASTLIVCVLSGFIVLEREIKKRKIIETVGNRIQTNVNTIKTKYFALKEEVGRANRMAALFLPHMIYLSLICLFFISFQRKDYEILNDGYFSFVLILGMPILRSIQISVLLM